MSLTIRLCVLQKAGARVAPRCDAAPGWPGWRGPIAGIYSPANVPMPGSLSRSVARRIRVGARKPMMRIEKSVAASVLPRGQKAREDLEV